MERETEGKRRQIDRQPAREKQRQIERDAKHANKEQRSKCTFNQAEEKYKEGERNQEVERDIQKNIRILLRGNQLSL